MAQENIYKLWRRRRNLKLTKRHISNALHINDDILSEAQQKSMEEMIVEAESFGPEDGKKIDQFIDEMPERVERCLAKKGSRLMREYVDVFAVAVMVAFGIRGLFLQPFQIPTGSMQPTLFGIHFVEAGAFPRLGKLGEEVIFGASRAEAKVKAPGMFDPESFRAVSAFPWGTDTVFRIGNESYKLPGEPEKVREYCPLAENYSYNTGEPLCNGWLSSGDHLFVDRYSHHLAGWKRGDVIVFNTEGIIYNGVPLANRGYYYIKRLIGLSGDTLQIKNNMVWVKPEGEKEFRPITDFNPAFAKIYSFKGGYHGHLNIPGQILDSPESTFTVPSDCYFAMGDNSISSLDSRYWGVVPRKNVVGKGFFVFWPFNRRWGPVDVRPPLDVATDPQNGFKTMNKQ